jgi:murein DD-endopeptidase MepM/ murein hydrolase activator NlpD
VNCRRGLKAAVVVTTAALLVTLPPAMSGAQTQDDLEQAEDEAAEALEHATEREREAALRYAEATEALPKARARLDAARERVNDAGVLVESAAEEERAAERALELATVRYEEVRLEVEQAEERISTLATAAYKSSNMYTVSAVLSASGPEDLVRQLGVIGRVAANERDAMRELTVAQATADAARDEAHAAQQRAEDARVAAQQALDAAETARREAEAAAEEVTALVDARAEALAVAEEERERAEAELARIEDELREWEEANLDGAPELASGAQLLMPVDGVETSDYGIRIDPVTGAERLHAGVDFAAPGGTPIWAAAAGTVIQAGWADGYGNFTCVSHGTYEGQGMSTCYAHQSEIQVGAGEAVDAGETIGLVGTTGNSTGNHLHFEVRLDGSPVDPLPWLPDCLC